MTDIAHQPASVPAADAVQERDATAVIGRRILAWVLDVLLYLGLSVALFAALAEYVVVSEAFPVDDACQLVRDSAPGADEVSSCIDVSGIPVEGLEDRVFVTSADDNALQSLASLGYLVFFVLLQGLTGGSPGKLLTGLRVVDEQGRRAGVGRSFVRTLLWVVDGAPWFLPLVGFIVGVTSTGHRRVGDLVARTYVVSAGDTGRPVRVQHAWAPPGQQAWGSPAPTPSWQDPAKVIPPAPGTSPVVTPAPERRSGPGHVVPPGEAVDPSVPESVVPDISGVPGESPAPPSTAGISAPPEWHDLTGDRDGPPAGAPVEEPPVERPTTESTTPTTESTVPTDESTPPTDEATHEVAVDPAWWSGPEAAPSSGGRAHGPDDPPVGPAGTDPGGTEPEAMPWDDPSPSPVGLDDWAPPTTPSDDYGTADDPSPTAGPTPFVAPGTDPRTEAPSTPQANPTPPPRWDEARDTYIQWDPGRQMWLQWDTVGNRWKIIDT